MFGGGRTMKSNGTEGLVLNEPFIFELQDAGACGIDIPEFDIDFCDPGNDLPDDLLRKDVEGIPNLTEPQVIRHYTRLSTWNYSLDGGFYPLGSCTMKYNPKINEAVAAMPGFANAHPYLPDKLGQGMLQLLFELQNDLTEISGLSTTCLHPAAGSHGELLGMLLIRAYHDDHQDFARTKIIIPDSAH
jgi:glycine dehydrogenase subunit 2